MLRGDAFGARFWARCYFLHINIKECAHTHIIYIYIYGNFRFVDGLLPVLKTIRVAKKSSSGNCTHVAQPPFVAQWRLHIK